MLILLLDDIKIINFLHVKFFRIFTYYFYRNIYISMIYASVLHILSLIAQFGGHFYFEGNRPALTDSLIQAFLVAPIFVLIDIKQLCNE